MHVVSGDLQQRTHDYQKHLDRVSRSFAFCIARLEGTFKFHVGHCYLMFRVLDTIEDAPWQRPADRQRSFDEFNLFLKERPERARLNSWIKNLLTLDIPEGERLLLEDSGHLFEDFHNLLESEVQKTLLRCLQNMSRGMEYYAGDKGAHLKTLEEVNRYCFFVAGIVGELLHDLFLRAHPQSHKSLSGPEDWANALHLGLFLQKVNILKDQQTDEAEGRHLVPSRELVLSSLLANARKGLKYIQRLPQEALPYRVFCSWSLFLGLASLPWIERSWRKKEISLKIPRLKTKLLLDKVEVKAADNDQLAGLFEKLIQEVGLEPQGMEPSKGSTFPDFEKLYHGALSPGQLQSLGLISSPGEVSSKI